MPQHAFDFNNRAHPCGGCGQMLGEATPFCPAAITSREHVFVTLAPDKWDDLDTEAKLHWESRANFGSDFEGGTFCVLCETQNNDGGECPVAVRILRGLPLLPERHTRFPETPSKAFLAATANAKPVVISPEDEEAARRIWEDCQRFSGEDGDDQ